MQYTLTFENYALLFKHYIPSSGIFICYQNLPNHQKSAKDSLSAADRNLNRKPFCLGKFTNFLAKLQAKYYTTSKIKHSCINTEVILKECPNNRFHQSIITHKFWA